MALNAGWIARQTGDDQSRRLYEQERLVVWAGEEIAASLEDAGMTRADLARKLGTSRAYITRVLQGSSNLTLRSLSDMAWAMGARVSLAFEPLREGQFVSGPVIVYKFPPLLVHDEEESSPDEGVISWTADALSA